MAHAVGILLLDGFTDSGPAITLDVLRAANALVRRKLFRVALLSERGGSARAASGSRVTTQGRWRDASRFETVLVPGRWAESAEDLPRWLARPETRRAANLVRSLHRKRQSLGASCGGTFLLAEAGVLDGRTATTTWWAAEVFRERFPRVQLDVDRALVIDGHVATAGAVFAAADLALSMVTRVGGPELAQQVARVLLLDGHVAQTPYVMLRQSTQRGLAQNAEAWVRQHVAEAPSVVELAKAMKLSERSLARHLHASVGLSPVAFMQRVRLEVATHLLETTSLAVEEVSERVGYAESATLRKLFRSVLHTSPKEVRTRARVLHA
ncbi:MAG: helix-turn-helix domain-containing protein [Archangium sp.]